MHDHHRIPPLMAIVIIVDRRATPPAGLIAVENPFAVGVGLEQQGDLLAQLGVVAAGLVQERLPAGDWLLCDRQKNLPDSLKVCVHGMDP